MVESPEAAGDADKHSWKTRRRRRTIQDSRL